MSKPLIFNIQKYSIHDGGGIRTTVFFKGCPLSCQWCHNPESQSFQKELLFHADRCTGCGACIAACPHGAVSEEISRTSCATCDSGQLLSAERSPSGNAVPQKGLRPVMNRSQCRMCGACINTCPHNAREETGKEYELSDLIRELEKDRMFYEQSDGGITLSGGEPLAQDMDYIEALARRLYEKGYSVNVDTCGYVPYEHIRQVLPYTDIFLYDIKLLDAKAHLDYTGVDNGLILENLIRLSADGGKINIRLPLIDGVNATEEHLRHIILFLQNNEINPYRINLLKYHSTGSGKYARLDRRYDHSSMAVPDEQWLDHAVSLFRQSGFHNTQIGG